MGNILFVYVHAANIHDTVSGIIPAHDACRKYPSIQAFCGDRGYRKTFEEDVAIILQRRVEISEKIKPHEWKLLPKRWIVERTFSWFNGSRRLSKDYEILPEISEYIVKISHICILLKRFSL